MASLRGVIFLLFSICAAEPISSLPFVNLYDLPAPNSSSPHNAILNMTMKSLLQQPADVVHLHNMSDDFKVTWRVIGNRKWFGGSGLGRLRLVHKASSSLVHILGGELLLRSSHADGIRSWAFQGVLFPRTGVGLGAFDSSPGMLPSLDNVRIRLPNASMASAELLAASQLSRVPGSLSSSRQQRMCYFVASLHVYSRMEYALPEWQRPTEREIGSASPYVEVEGVIFSPNCKNVLVNITGKSVFTKEVVKKAQSYGLLVFVLNAGFCLSLFSQMRWSASTLRASRVSGVSTAICVLIDAYLLLLHILTGFMITDAVHLFYAMGFAQFVLFTFFEMRFFAAIWRANMSSSAYDGRQFFKVYLAGFIAFTVFFHLPAIWWIFLFSFFSFWVPQIIENARKGANKSLKWSYILWGTLGRLGPVIYFCLVPDNFLEIRPRPRLAIALTTYMVLQVVLLLAQDIFGPRFFLPFIFADPYHYKRPINALDVDNCVICLNPVTEEQIQTQQYMITPCQHCFHEECLLQWMNARLTCPTCRSAIPPTATIY